MKRELVAEPRSPPRVPHHPFTHSLAIGERGGRYRGSCVVTGAAGVSGDIAWRWALPVPGRGQRHGASLTARPERGGLGAGRLT